MVSANENFKELTPEERTALNNVPAGQSGESLKLKPELNRGLMDELTKNAIEPGRTVTLVIPPSIIASIPEGFALENYDKFMKTTQVHYITEEYVNIMVERLPVGTNSAYLGTALLLTAAALGEFRILFMMALARGYWSGGSTSIFRALKLLPNGGAGRIQSAYSYAYCYRMAKMPGFADQARFKDMAESDELKKSVVEHLNAFPALEVVDGATSARAQEFHTHFFESWIGISGMNANPPTDPLSNHSLDFVFATIAFKQIVSLWKDNVANKEAANTTVNTLFKLRGFQMLHSHAGCVIPYIPSIYLIAHNAEDLIWPAVGGDKDECDIDVAEVSGFRQLVIIELCVVSIIAHKADAALSQKVINLKKIDQGDVQIHKRQQGEIDWFLTQNTWLSVQCRKRISAVVEEQATLKNMITFMRSGSGTANVDDFKAIQDQIEELYGKI